MMSRNALLLVVIAGVAVLGAGILAQETARPASGQNDTPRSSHGSKGGRSRITPEQEQELLDGIKDKRPELYEQAVGLKKTDPEKYRRMLYMLQWSQRRLQALPEDVRQRVQAEMDARLKVSRLLRDIRATDSEPKRKPLIKKLKVAVAEHFDAEQKGREGRLTMLEEQIKRLRAEMEQRAKDRDRIIKDRVNHYMENPASPTEGGSRHHPSHVRPVKDAPAKD
jgi:hypothetical protein